MFLEFLNSFLEVILFSSQLPDGFNVGSVFARKVRELTNHLIQLLLELVASILGLFDLVSELLLLVAEIVKVFVQTQDLCGLDQFVVLQGMVQLLEVLKLGLKIFEFALEVLT